MHITPGKYEYNLDKAKALMEEMGYNDNNRLHIKSAMMDTTTYKSFSENFQFQLSQFYIDWELEFGDVATVQKAANIPGSTDINMQFNLNGSVRFEMYDSISHCRMIQRALWNYRDDPTFNKLFDDMVYTTDDAVWQNAEKEMQQFIFDEYFFYPICEYATAFGYRTDRLTEAQCKAFTAGMNQYQLDRLGFLASWQ